MPRMPRPPRLAPVSSTLPCCVASQESDLPSTSVCDVPVDCLARILLAAHHASQADAASLRMASKVLALCGVQYPGVLLQLPPEDDSHSKDQYSAPSSAAATTAADTALASLERFITSHPNSIGALTVTPAETDQPPACMDHRLADASAVVAALAHNSNCSSVCLSQCRLGAQSLFGSCLAALTLDRCHVSGISHTAIDGLTQLRSLTLKWSRLDLTDGRLQLQQLAHLERFVLFTEHGNNDAGLPSRLVMPPSIRHVTLHSHGCWYTLDLSDAPLITSIANHYFAFYAASHPVVLNPYTPYRLLTTWHGCPIGSLEGRRAPLPALRALSLAYVSKWGLCEAVERVGRLAHALQELTISVWGSGSMAVRLDPTHLPSLRTLAFTGPGPLLEELHVACLPKLESVDLGQLTAVRGAASVVAAPGVKVLMALPQQQWQWQQEEEGQEAAAVADGLFEELWDLFD